MLSHFRHKTKGACCECRHRCTAMHPVTDFKSWYLRAVYIVDVNWILQIIPREFIMFFKFVKILHLHLLLLYHILPIVPCIIIVIIITADVNLRLCIVATAGFLRDPWSPIVIARHNRSDKKMTETCDAQIQTLASIVTSPMFPVDLAHLIASLPAAVCQFPIRPTSPMTTALSFDRRDITLERERESVPETLPSRKLLVP